MSPSTSRVKSPDDISNSDVVNVALPTTKPLEPAVTLSLNTAAPPSDMSSSKAVMFTPLVPLSSFPLNNMSGLIWLKIE